MSLDPITSILDIGGKVIDKIFPDADQREKAKVELSRLNQAGELEELKTRMSAILAEAQSADPWTSRARPSFLYVCYILILMAIPMGILSAFSPETATRIAAGFREWLAAIPADIVTLMGVGYLGYTGARTLDKAKIVK